MLLAISRCVIEVPADALSLALSFSFALVISLLRICSCRLRLEIELRFSFRLGLRDDLGVVAVGTRARSARLAVADGETRVLLLLDFRHHKRDVRAAVLVDPGDLSELAIRTDLLHERKACILR